MLLKGFVHLDHQLYNQTSIPFDVQGFQQTRVKQRHRSLDLNEMIVQAILSEVAKLKLVNLFGSIIVLVEVG